MIVGIDIDDTITDTYEVMMAYASEYTVDVLNKEPIMRDISNCDNHFYMRNLNEWNEGEDLKFLDEYYEKIISNVKPKTLSLKYLNKIHEEGNKIILITARWETDKFDVKKITTNWIKENNIPYDKLIINAENKLIVAKSEKLDVFIDDSFQNCKMVSSAGIKTFIMDTRVNKGLKDDKIERIYSWPHLYMKLKKLENYN